MERRSEIYVTRQLKRRLFSVLKLYPQTTTLHPERDGFSIQERLMTVEELVEKILLQHIKENYPNVLKLEQEIAKLEKQYAKVNDSSGIESETEAGRDRPINPVL